LQTFFLSLFQQVDFFATILPAAEKAKDQPFFDYQFFPKSPGIADIPKACNIEVS